MNPRKGKTARAPEAEMLQCQERIGYLFRREGLLRKALTHSSVKDEKNPSNERLEFLGDAILGMVISEYLFSLLPGNDEGDLTKVKSVVVSSHTLARLGEELEVDKFLLIGKGIRLRKEIPRSLLANAVEAIIAAVYLDRGMEAARHFVLDHLHSYVQEVLQDDHREKNFKSILQQHAQKEFSATPVYHVRAASGPDHSKSFHIVASIGDREFPVGRGHSKKEAEQEAARSALRALKERHPRASKKGKKKAQRSKKAAQKKRQTKVATQAQSAPKKAQSAPKKAQRKSKKAKKAAQAEPKAERKTRRRRSRAPSSNGR